MFRDGTKVSDLMANVLNNMWSATYPNPALGPCVGFKNLNLVNGPCDNSGSYYFNISTDSSVLNTTKPLLGYLCETRYLLRQKFKQQKVKATMI